ncbi:MAG: GGDEF domain-containing protein [Sideroxydans sp.]|nr:GGDEF domain-containing protein [Sideroxydans sp.]
MSAILIAAEVMAIAYLDFLARATYFSLEVLYCLPVIQAAQLGTLQAMRRSDSHNPTIAAIAVALVWSAAEALVIWPEFPWQAFALNVFTRSVTFTVIGRVVNKLWKERGRVDKDPLTQLASRFDFFERFEIELERSERSGSPYSMVYIDIDHFKSFNDERGHQTGDAALQLLADILRDNSRRIDIVTRISGDDFVLVYPDTEESTCIELVERIRQDADKAFRRRGWPVSLSVGHITETGIRLNGNEALREAEVKMNSDRKAKH